MASKLQEQFLLRLAWVSRRVWRVKGWDRVLRLLHTPDRVGAGADKDCFHAVVPYDDHLLVHVNTGNFLEWTVFFKGYYEPENIQLYKQFLRLGMVVVDVGANIGLHTLVFSTLVTESGKVIAFEPNPTVAQRLRENCALNRIRNVELLPFACSRSGGGSGILIVNRDSNPTGHLQSRERVTWENSSRLRDLISVEVTTLDEALVSCDRVDFIKIDVDGGEYDVLLGGEGVLERCHPHLL